MEQKALEGVETVRHGQGSTLGGGVRPVDVEVSFALVLLCVFWKPLAASLSSEGDPTFFSSPSDQ